MGISREKNKRNKSLFGMSLTHEDIRLINVFTNIFIIEAIAEHIGWVEFHALKASLEDTSCIVKNGVIQEWVGFIILSTWGIIQEIHNEHTTGIESGIDIEFQGFKSNKPVRTV